MGYMKTQTQKVITGMRGNKITIREYREAACRRIRWQNLSRKHRKGKRNRIRGGNDKEKDKDVKVKKAGH